MCRGCWDHLSTFLAVLTRIACGTSLMFSTPEVISLPTTNYSYSIRVSFDCCGHSRVLMKISTAAQSKDIFFVKHLGCHAKYANGTDVLRRRKTSKLWIITFYGLKWLGNHSFLCCVRDLWVLNGLWRLDTGSLRIFNNNWDSIVADVWFPLWYICAVR